MSEPSSPPPSPERVRANRQIVRITIAGGAVMMVGLVVFLGWLVQGCQEAKATSLQFVAAVRAGRFDDAYALTSPDLRALLVKAPSVSNPSHTFELLRGAPEIDLGVVQSGFGGNWPVIPFACFDGELPGEKKFWIVARRDQVWRVVDLRSDAKPKVCEGGE